VLQIALELRRMQLEILVIGDEDMMIRRIIENVNY